MYHSFKHAIQHSFVGDLGSVIQKIVSDPDAHIAGGFVDMYMSHKIIDGVVQKELPSSWWFDVVSYFRFGGDIDVFLTENSYNRIKPELSLLLNHSITKETGVPTFNINVDSSLALVPFNVLKQRFPEQINIQFVLIKDGVTAFENVSGFDLTNSKCYIQQGLAYYTDKWVELRQKNMIHVDTWAKPLKTIKRIVKYSHRHKYKSLTPQTEKEIIEKSIEILHKANETPDEFVEEKNSKYVSTPLLTTMRSFLPMLSPENILLIASITQKKDNIYQSFDIETLLNDNINRKEKKSLIYNS